MLCKIFLVARFEEENDAIYAVILHSGKLLVACKGHCCTFHRLCSLRCRCVTVNTAEKNSIHAIMEIQVCV